MKKVFIISCLFLCIIIFIIIRQIPLNEKFAQDAFKINPGEHEKSYVKIVAVGDILCSNQNLGSSCQEDGIAKLIKDINPQAILIPGDSQYEKGTSFEYQKYFESFLGKYKEKIYPAPGNHDYYIPKASGYYDYFNGVGKYDGRVGSRDQGFYSFNLENWHIISINSNCADIGGCQKGSVQEKWLLSDLQKNKLPCILAFWHEPRFSSGPHGSNLIFKDIWTDLYNSKADIIINGHDHDYERFKMQDPEGKEDEKGIREFVVGTGGSLLYRLMNIEKNSEVSDSSSHGVLELKLYSDKYDWNFWAVEGDNFKDTGSNLCNLKN